MLQGFSFLTGACGNDYLVIKQNIFEFSSESRVHENEHFAGKIPVCFLDYRNKVRHPSTAKLLTQVCATYHSGIA